MSRDSQRREELLAELLDMFRQLSAATIMFHQAIADRLGMNVTDHKCADVLLRAGPMTAGELADYTGLTTGATTGVIDPLEAAGFVRRAPYPHDSRCVVVEPNLKGIERVIGPLFESIARSSAELCARYSTEELAVIRDFTTRAQQLAMDEARMLRGDDPPAKARR